MTIVFWQNSVSLYPASFCTSRPNLPVTPGIFLTSYFAFQSPVMKRTSFFGVSSRSSCGSSENQSTSASSGDSAGEASACHVGNLGSIPGLGGSPGEENSYPLQCPGVENSRDCIIHRVSRSWAQLSELHFS